MLSSGVVKRESNRECVPKCLCLQVQVKTPVSCSLDQVKSLVFFCDLSVTRVQVADSSFHLCFYKPPDPTENFRPYDLIPSSCAGKVTHYAVKVFALRLSAPDMTAPLKPSNLMQHSETKDKNNFLKL